MSKDYSMSGGGGGQKAESDAGGGGLERLNPGCDMSDHNEDPRGPKHMGRVGVGVASINHMVGPITITLTITITISYL